MQSSEYVRAHRGKIRHVVLGGVCCDALIPMAQKTWETEETETREETKEIRETEDIRMDRRDRGEMEAEDKRRELL